MLSNPESIFFREPNLLVPQRKPIWSVKPNWLHPLSRNLIGCWLFQEQENQNKFFDATGNNHGTRVGSLTGSTSRYGKSLQITNDNSLDRINLGSIGGVNPLLLSNNIVSILSLVKGGTSLSNSHGSQFPRLIDKSDGGFGSNGWVFYETVETNKVSKIILDFGSSSKEVVANVSVNPGEWHFIGCSIDTTTTARRIMHLNGNSLVRAIDHTGTIPQTTVNAALLNWNHSSDRQWRTPVVFIYVWDRLLSLAEHQSLCRDPYQFLVPA